MQRGAGVIIEQDKGLATAAWPGLTLGFDLSDGEWLWIEGHGLARSEWRRASAGTAGFGLDDAPAEFASVSLLSLEADDNDSTTLVVTQGLGQSTRYRLCEIPRYVLRVFYRYDSAGATLLRWARWEWPRRVHYYGTAQARLTGIWLGLPIFHPPHRAAWRVDAAWDRWQARRPFEQVVELPRIAREGEKNFYALLSAPDHAPGAISVYRDGIGAGWTVLGECVEVPVFPEVFGEQGGLAVRHEFGVARRVREDDSVECARQVLRFHTSAAPNLVEITRSQHIVWAGEPPAAAHWLHGAAVAECFPSAEGGFRGLAARMPALKAAGFDVVYLMPITRGGYSNVSASELEPSLGDEADLRALLTAAREQGLRVILDLLLTITQPASQLARMHPEWLICDDRGKPLRSISWGGLSIDWGHPAYHDYMLEQARRWLEYYGFDGFRVDAPMHKEVNWNADGDAAPDRTPFGAIRFLSRLRAMIDREFPRAGLLSEAPGPLLTRDCHACYDAPAYVMDWLKEQVESGAMEGGAVAAWLMQRLSGCRDTRERVVSLKSHDIATPLSFEHPTHAALWTALTLLPCAQLVYMSIPCLRYEQSPESVLLRRLLAWRRCWNLAAGPRARFIAADGPALVYTYDTGEPRVVIANLSPRPFHLAHIADVELPGRAAVIAPDGGLFEQRTPALLDAYCALVA